MVSPWRFIIFVVVLLVSILPARALLGSLSLGVIVAFDVAALIFFGLCWNLLRIEDPAKIERIAERVDADRLLLLVITAIVTAVLLIALAAETVAKHPGSLYKFVVIATLIIAWLFSNTVYALHYTHLAYSAPGKGCFGFNFPKTPEPVYWDFIYFSFTLGMAFATSDVEVTELRIRKIVAFHCLAAFSFNIGVLAFTVNLLASSAS